MRKNMKTLKLYLKNKYDLEALKPQRIKEISDLFKPTKNTSYIFTKENLIFQDISNEEYHEAVINYLDIKELKEIKIYNLINNSFKKTRILHIITQEGKFKFTFEKKKEIKKILKLIYKYHSKSIDKIKLLMNK